jgi:outer membrane immunogenic protein
MTMKSSVFDHLMMGLSSLAGISMLLLSGPPALSEPFRGAYVGASLGYQHASGANGLSYGGYVGYNLRPTSRLVVGAELGLGGSTLSQTFRVETPTHVTLIEDSLGLSVSIAGRLGWLATDRTLLYGRLGWDNVQQRQVQTRTPKPPVANPRAETFEATVFADSLTVGGGVEQFVTDTVSLRLDYDYAPSFHRHQLRVGVGYNF